MSITVGETEWTSKSVITISSTGQNIGNMCVCCQKLLEIIKLLCTRATKKRK